MSQARMNLFRELKAPKRRARKSAPRPLQLKLAGFILVMASLLTARSYLRFRATSRVLEAQVRQLDQELNDLTEAKTREAASRPRDAASLAKAIPEGPAPDSKDIDGTWTSLLWKIATGAEVGIALDKLDLTEVAVDRSHEPERSAALSAPGAPILPPREVVLQGQARSLRDITAWLERLARRIPGFAFVLDHQTDTRDPDYPIVFKVTARAT